MPSFLIFGISHTLHRSLHILLPRSHPPHIWGCVSIVIATAVSPAGIWTLAPPTISPIKVFPPTSSLFTCLSDPFTHPTPPHSPQYMYKTKARRKEGGISLVFVSSYFLPNFKWLLLSSLCFCARIKTVTICALIAANLATWIISNSNRVTVLHKEKPLLFLMNTLTLSSALSP